MEYLLSEYTRDRLMRMLRKQPGDAPFHGRPRNAPWVLVRCTSASAVGGDSVLNQCYPANVLSPAWTTVAPPDESVKCLLTVLGASGNSVAPVADKVYAAILAGEVETDRSGSISGRLRAFAVEDDAGSAVTTYYSTPGGGDVSMPTSATNYDSGASLSLPAGTFVLTADVSVLMTVSGYPGFNMTFTGEILAGISSLGLSYAVTATGTGEFRGTASVTVVYTTVSALTVKSRGRGSFAGATFSFGPVIEAAKTRLSAVKFG